MEFSQSVVKRWQQYTIWSENSWHHTKWTHTSAFCEQVCIIYKQKK